jgi:hypothetical protein
MLLNSEKPSFHEKVNYCWKAVASLSVVSWLLDVLGLWFKENSMFSTAMLIAFAANMVWGFLWHRKLGGFKWRIFWRKNIEMWFTVLCVYPLLWALYKISGDNIVAEGFKVMVQVGTMLYPGSKALKNAYLFTDKKYPPGFIMNRLYNFEKSGDVRDLYGKDDNNLNAG